jgi:hypothetical protein
MDWLHNRIGRSATAAPIHSPPSSSSEMRNLDGWMTRQMDGWKVSWHPLIYVIMTYHNLQIFLYSSNSTMSFVHLFYLISVLTRLQATLWETTCFYHWRFLEWLKAYLLKCCGIRWSYWCSRCGYVAKLTHNNTNIKSIAIVNLKKICLPKKIASIIYKIWCVLRGVLETILYLQSGGKIVETIFINFHHVIILSPHLFYLISPKPNWFSPWSIT